MASERADAARNRLKVLAAAGKLFAERDPKSVTMDEIAKAAGVGRATLYRRYPDPGSVARALLAEHETELQDRIAHGPPPLGPGAEPGERLAAFYRAMVELLERHLHLALGAETFRTGAYGFWCAHVETLLRAAAVEAPPALAGQLMAPLAPELYEYQRHGRGLSVDQVSDGLAWLAVRALGRRHVPSPSVLFGRSHSALSGL